VDAFDRAAVAGQPGPGASAPGEPIIAVLSAGVQAGRLSSNLNVSSLGKNRAMDNQPRISSQVASPPDRNKLVVELWWGNEQWAEINQESGSLEIELYPRKTGEPWRFPLLEVIEAVQMAGPHLLRG
jgi:hypothetical protein